MKKGFLTGLLLFGFFFGAGNLIFPPSLGLFSGQPLRDLFYQVWVFQLLH